MSKIFKASVSLVAVSFCVGISLPRQSFAQFGLDKIIKGATEQLQNSPSLEGRSNSSDEKIYRCDDNKKNSHSRPRECSADEFNKLEEEKLTKQCSDREAWRSSFDRNVIVRLYGKHRKTIDDFYYNDNIKTDKELANIQFPEKPEFTYESLLDTWDSTWGAQPKKIWAACGRQEYQKFVEGSDRYYANLQRKFDETKIK